MINLTLANQINSLLSISSFRPHSQGVGTFDVALHFQVQDEQTCGIPTVIPAPLLLSDNLIRATLDSWTLRLSKQFWVSG